MGDAHQLTSSRASREQNPEDLTALPGDSNKKDGRKLRTSTAKTTGNQT